MSDTTLLPPTDQNPVESWQNLSWDERKAYFKSLPREEAEDMFLDLPTSDQAELVREMVSGAQRRSWLRLLPPDDVADLIQQFESPEKAGLLALLDETTKREVLALLLYSEDEAGGLMNPRFVRLRPDVSADVALRYYRMQSRQQVEFIEYAYVLDQEQRVLGIVTLRDLLLASPDKAIGELMNTEVVTVPEAMDQEEVSQKFAQLGIKAIPVVDQEGRMKGIVTVDDIVDVVREEAAEDIQKMGGTEALDEPYLTVPIQTMIKKRAGWLVVLFLGEMLTATAMGHFAEEIERAVILAVFIPLIISSGGNSGSQATSLVIRSLALREFHPRDWFRIFRRELLTGLGLGAILGTIGFLRIAMWPTREQTYGEHFLMIGSAVAVSLLGVVLWGCLAGSMLPLLLKKLGFDPATASAPFVATLVDVTGILIYFSMATLLLRGTLL